MKYGKDYNLRRCFQIENEIRKSLDHRAANASMNLGARLRKLADCLKARLHGGKEFLPQPTALGLIPSPSSF